jgi:hypothetical protein
MKTFFAHLRTLNEDGSIAGNGGMTIAYQVLEVDGHTRIIYSYAKCHEKDRYNKYLGRTKAAGRLKSFDYTQTFTGTKREFLDHMYGLWQDY